jgi:hypothetical protein
MRCEVSINANNAVLKELVGALRNRRCLSGDRMKLSGDRLTLDIPYDMLVVIRPFCEGWLCGYKTARIHVRLTGGKNG